MTPLLETRGLTVTVPAGPGSAEPRTLVRGLDWRAYAGELWGLLGRNGTGKSTLLRALAGQGHAAGELLWSGEPVGLDSGRFRLPGDRARHMAFLQTRLTLPGHMLGRELAALGRQPHTGWMGRLTASDESVVTKALASAGAEPLAEKPLGRLSDGERQRLQVARILAQEAPLILMDEPLAHLDWPGRKALLQTLSAAARQRSACAIVSVHEIELALAHCDRLLLLDGRGGWEILEGGSEAARARIEAVFSGA